MFSPGFQHYNGNYGKVTVPYVVLPLVAIATGGEIIPAVAGKTTRVLALFGNGSATSTITFVSNAVSKTGAINTGTTLPVCMPFNPAGWFDSEVGYLISATISSGTFGGTVIYVSF